MSDAAASEIAPEEGSRVARKRARRSRDILRTAASLLAEKGYEGTNLEEIGARLELRGPSLYHYFPSKDVLLEECVTLTAREVTGRALAIATGDEPPRQRLQQLFFDQVLVCGRDYPEFVALFVHLRIPDPDLAARVRDLRRRHHDVFRAVVAEGVKAGELRGPHTDVALMLAFGALSYVGEWYDEGGPLSLEELAETLARELMSLFDGRGGG